jgi:hypothetical protein
VTGIDDARRLAEDAFVYTKPILERLGLRQIATVHALVDRA